MRARGRQKNFADAQLLFQEFVAFLCETAIPGNVADLKGLGNISKLIPKEARSIKGYTYSRHLPFNASADHR